MLEQRRHVHGETPAIALAEPIPPTDRIRLGSSPGFEGAVLGRLVLVGAPEFHPVAARLEHDGDVLEASREVAELGGSDLADQLRWVGGVVAMHLVLGRPRWGSEDPRVVRDSGTG